MDQSNLDPNYFYTVKELAFLWNMSDDTIRRLFTREPEVIILVMARRGRRTTDRFAFLDSLLSAFYVGCR